MFFFSICLSDKTPLVLVLYHLNESFDVLVQIYMSCSPILSVQTNFLLNNLSVNKDNVKRQCQNSSLPDPRLHVNVTNYNNNASNYCLHNLVIYGQMGKIR